MKNVVCQLLIISYLLITTFSTAQAYEVEADSTGNTVFILLNNTNPVAAFDSAVINASTPAFVTAASASIVPAVVGVNKSELAALDFDIAPSAMAGASGDLVITVSGTAAGLPVSVPITVPLEVVASAPTAQGVIGIGVPVADEGGIDTDGDGISDLLEQAFGSNALSAASVPGDMSTFVVPLFSFVAYLILTVLFFSIAKPFIRRRSMVGK